MYHLPQSPFLQVLMTHCVLLFIHLYMYLYVDEGEKNLRFKYDAPKKVVEVKKPGLNISKDFVITFS